MSEEILKALMQLLAILARQDGGVLEGHEKFVSGFLSSQLSDDRVNEYLTIYHNFLNEAKEKQSDSADSGRTSMKDSVRTLAICKKINKTLVQKQKFIVLIRLLEFFKQDAGGSVNRMQIVETVADVFKIEKDEFEGIRNFVLRLNQIEPAEVVISATAFTGTCRKSILHPLLDGMCRFFFVKTINVVIFKYQGNSEIYLNGIVIRPDVVSLFPPGSTLRLPHGSVYFATIISAFMEEEGKEEFSFSAHILEHRFPNGKVALHELTIHEPSGNLVGIMGASGSGKTTLLTLLSGQEKPSTGSVFINELDLFKYRKQLEGAIGFVPQDDLLIEDLTVFQNLYYNAKLCFRNISEQELVSRTTKVLTSLGLEEIGSLQVGSPLNKKISGGQRKRLNIGLELIREPAILFLDEPTSGLSSRDSENVMDLLKELTFKGKLVFVVIHQPSSDIFKMFDRMLILDTGGYPAYYGNPIEAVMYFKKVTKQLNENVGECYACGSVNPELIFNLIELKELDDYGNYTTTRKISPEHFYQLYKENIHLDPKREIKEGKLNKTLQIPGKLKQILIYFKRDFLSKSSNLQYIIINLLEVPVLALFLSLFIRHTNESKTTEYTYFHNENIPAFFFMAVLAALLVGLTVSAEEIFRDQKILKRERFLHLSRLSYLLSKVGLLFLLSIIQTILFIIVGFLILDIRENYFTFGLILFSVFCFANLFGLVLSSTFNSPVTIYIIIPLIIIPQMVLGGAMFQFSKLNELFGGGYKVPQISNTMVSRWAYEAIALDMFINNSFEKEKYRLDRFESKFNYKLVYLFPLIEDNLATDTSTRKLSDEKFAGIAYELTKQQTEAIAIGYKGPAENITRKNAGSILAGLKDFYKDKFIEIEQIIEDEKIEASKTKGGIKEYEKYKFNYHNQHLEDLLTNSIEKEKITFDGNAFVQVIDPVFKDAGGSRMCNIDASLFTPVKYLFGLKLPSYWFNLIMIWAINVITFLLLFWDAPRKLLNLFASTPGLIKNKI